MNPKVLGYVNYGTGRVKPFDISFPQSHLLSTVDDIYDGKVTALVIWGGEDISPSIYGETANSHTHAANTLSRRDKVEVDMCQAAINCDIPIIGVCRGAQLLCALAGGTLVQHVDGHHNDHKIVTSDGRTMTTSSIHHQMMLINKTEHELIAWSAEKQSMHYLGEADAPLDMTIEPEIVYFPKIKGLAIQGHPEFMDRGSEFVKYCNELVSKYLLDCQC